MSQNFRLASTIPQSFQDPANYEQIFSKEEREDLYKQYTLPREAPAIGQPHRSCDTHLFLGFFFDGTRNHYGLSEERGDHTFSNVARLFDAYPGQTIAPQSALKGRARWPNEAAYPNYFRIYIPGVGTPFEELGDSGRGLDGLLGSATARWGERRLMWALAQALNAVHRYFLKTSLVTHAEVVELSRLADLNRHGLRAEPRFVLPSEDGPQAANIMAHWHRILQRLHEALRVHMVDPVTQRPQRIDPGIVRHVYVSAFGFSRGAAAARAFANWFVALCELDARMLGRSGRTLAGFPVQFDFLGLFDTVASVGLAPLTLLADGHGAWADAEVSLRIPAGVACTHLVSAHEVRRSFALDSISVGGVLPPNCQEIVYPGVHSDVGGGYAPGEQGRGNDPEGADLLSRIPLAEMYRQARLHGVPLKLELTRSFIKDRFRITPSTIEAFNAYIEASEAYASQYPRPGMAPLRACMRTQMELAMLWRRRWAGQVAQMPVLARARQEDRNDLLSADREFCEEIDRFEQWRRLQARGSAWCGDEVLDTCMRAEAQQVPGLDSGRFEEWKDIAGFWDRADVPPAVAALFETLIHDSRAWFKLSGWEASQVEDGLKRWVRVYDEYVEQLERARRWGEPLPPAPLGRRELEWVRHYKATGQVPPMRTRGREPFELGGGYLRFRRVYAGGDRLRLTRAPVRNPEAVPA
ncbi:MAG: DUF2235 domain-containing protein [Caldimonas manganoxidans]|nr:DUF2235 domain-containing protein [Caldimonas manganoxidans]